MLVTLSGIVTLVRPAPTHIIKGGIKLVNIVRVANARGEIPVTGRPLIVLGMVTGPTGPVYPVMMIVPLLVLQVNWACTTAGSVKSSNNNNRPARAARCWFSCIHDPLVNVVYVFKEDSFLSFRAVIVG